MKYSVRQLYKQYESLDQKEVTLFGWVRNNRAQKEFGFLNLNDGTFFETIQVVYENEFLENFKEVQKYRVGVSVRIKGVIFNTPDRKQPFEIKAREVELVGDSLEDYPIQPKRHTREFLRENAHLRPRTNLFSAVFRVRSILNHAIHTFFQERDFVHVAAPLITASDAEGAGETFKITTLDLDNLPFQTEFNKGDFSSDVIKKKNITEAYKKFTKELKNKDEYDELKKAKNLNDSLPYAKRFALDYLYSDCEEGINPKILRQSLKQSTIEKKFDKHFSRCQSKFFSNLVKDVSFDAKIIDIVYKFFKMSDIDYKQDFFQKKTNLTVSGQLEAEVFAMAFRDVYTFGPTFRAENSNTTTHASEFWMIEPEIAFADLGDDMDLAEDMVKYVIKYVMEKAPEEMQFFNKFVQKGLLDKLNKVVTSDFVRITHKEAVQALLDSNHKFENRPSFSEDLATEHEKFLVQLYDGPVFIIDWPKDIKAFYMRLNDDNETVAAMDLLVPGSGELIGGSQREERLEYLEKRMKEMNVPKDDLWWYLDLRKYGGCKHAGFGLGFDRMLMYLTGVENIRDVIPFPRTPRNCEF